MESLKARLFDLMDEKSELKKRIAMLESELADTEEELDGVRGELNTARIVAEKRAEMIRGLVSENRELKQKLPKTVAIGTNQLVERIKKEVRADIVRELQDSLEDMLNETTNF